MIPSNTDGPSSAGTSREWDVVVEQLGSALARKSTDDELRPVVREWCHEARGRNLAPEQFLVVLKSQFARIPAFQRQRDGSDGVAMMNRVLSICIEEYYREPGPVPPSRARKSEPVDGQHGDGDGDGR